MRRSESAAFQGLVQWQCCEMQGRSGVVLLSVCTAICLSKIELATPQLRFELEQNYTSTRLPCLVGDLSLPSKIVCMTTWLKATGSITNLTLKMRIFLEEPAKF
ncbi:hypothetical protein MPTK1_4g14820 [Marchantia polymorpha subsp. ruderalis]|uniref:Uncharacterized protein n=2 Tax=Marchantia polymorpha TaxID=3197 RepID=A0AAF6B9Z6_MARPO|nr:hypothetical protein MARPO_0965s0001 [Marchantia polymorpha]BBN08830.1 hypothetical protein Mp_4g14820 [Marchantia polymorpha subsp. ruderalis]|eukprot:PTQ26567.1 hypothetical protein MARPO_0965s0001 [Marchantia polymorpha]